MKVSGERTFDAPLAVVWSVLNDPSRMAKTMPGVESFEIQDDRHWTAKVKVPLGLGGLRMTIAIEKVEEREPEYAKLNAKGQGVGRDDEHGHAVQPPGRRRADDDAVGRPTSRSPARSGRWASACSSRS